MKVSWYSNACVRISSSEGGSILCDPWVNSGANLGSWFHWPPIPEDYQERLLSLELNGIFISHLHSDHYDPKFISKFTRKHPTIPIYIPSFAQKWLKKSLNSVVLNPQNIIELPTFKEVEVGPGLTITAFAADTCNPSICGTNIPCHTDPTLRGIDGIGVFKADGQILVNANDAMGVELVPKIAANIGRADILLGHYGAASPFPQCFPKVKNKEEVITQVVGKTCRMLLEAADSLGVKYLMPFAGQYVLGGRLVKLNDDVATLPLDQIVNDLQSLTPATVISMEPFGEFDFNLGSGSNPFTEPSAEIRDSYFAKISKAKFIYERKFATSWDSVTSDLEGAANNVIDKSRNARIGFDNSFVIGDGVHHITIDLFVKSENNSFRLGEAARNQNCTRITMPTGLLRMLTTKRQNFSGFTPLHWNQADGGSHFVWERTGEFDLKSHMLLNFFGA
jgi:UDP-MurNAc hydroxylase